MYRFSDDKLCFTEIPFEGLNSSLMIRGHCRYFSLLLDVQVFVNLNKFPKNLKIEYYT